MHAPVAVDRVVPRRQDNRGRVTGDRFGVVAAFQRGVALQSVRFRLRFRRHSTGLVFA